MDDFKLSGFTPYLLNMAAETQGVAFSKIYRSRYGMLRTEWRVLYHLGRHGPMSATEISQRARLHKTKISRAVRALETKRFLGRDTSATDRRIETLKLSESGQTAFRDLSRAASQFEEDLTRKLGRQDAMLLRKLLEKLSA